MSLLDCLEGCVDLVGVGDVALNPQHPIGYAATAIRRGHPMARCGEMLGDGAPDALAAAGDQH